MQTEIKKTCKDCDKEKLTVDFYVRTDYKGDHTVTNQCKTCRNAYKKKQEKANAPTQGNHEKVRNLLKQIIEACECRNSRRLLKAVTEAKSFLYQPKRNECV